MKNCLFNKYLYKQQQITLIGLVTLYTSTCCYYLFIQLASQLVIQFGQSSNSKQINNYQQINDQMNLNFTFLLNQQFNLLIIVTKIEFYISKVLYNITQFMTSFFLQKKKKRYINILYIFFPFSLFSFSFPYAFLFILIMKLSLSHFFLLIADFYGNSSQLLSNQLNKQLLPFSLFLKSQAIFMISYLLYYLSSFIPSLLSNFLNKYQIIKQITYLTNYQLFIQKINLNLKQQITLLLFFSFDTSTILVLTYLAYRRVKIN
ncbi:hypothetical protein ABPG74_019974 [Tetrahymena malaccensis]